MKQVSFSAIRPVLRRTAIVTGWVAGVLLVLLAGSAFTLYTLIPQAPTQKPWAEKLARYILTDIFEDADVRFDNLTIARGNLAEPIALRANAIRIYPKKETIQNGNPSLETENFSLEISPLELLIGNAAIDNVKIDKLKLVAQRDEKGRYQFGLAGSRPAKTAARTPVKPLAVLDRINNLAINDASLVFEDITTKKSEAIASITLNMRKDPQFNQSLITAYARENPSDPKPVFDFVLTTTESQKNAEVILYLHDLDLDRLTPWVPELAHHLDSAQGAFSGEIRLDYNKRNEVITDYKIALNSESGIIHFANAPQPLVYENINLAMDDDGLNLSADIQNHPVSLVAERSKLPAGGYDITLQTPNMAIADVATLMEEGKESTAQEWITQKLKNGTVNDVKVTGLLHRDAEKAWTFSNLVASGEVENMWVLYKHDFRPAENVTAKLHYEGDKLSLDLSKGNVAGVEIIEGKLDFLDLTKAGKGDCKGTLRLKGPLQSVLSYLDNPIIKYKERVAVDLSKASGNVQMTLGLDFPTTKDAAMEEIHVDVDAILRNANLPDIISGVSISGGPLALKGNANNILIRGDALLNKTPAHLTYQTYFDSENAPFVQKLDVKGTLSAATLQGFGAGAWAGDVKTPSKYTVSYDQPVGGALPKVSLNVKGNDLSVENATIALGKNNAFQSADLQGVVLGKTKGNVNVTRNAGNGYNINFTGPVFDARPVLASDDKKKSSKNPANLSAVVNASSMIMSDKGAMSSAKINFASNGKGDISRLVLSGSYPNGTAKINFSEAKNGDQLRVDITNAGGFLALLDLTQGVKGGTVSVMAAPNGAYGTMQGHAEMTDFTARDIPVLGRLINALSLPGLLQLFTTEGIYFQRLATDFNWEKGQSTSLLRLKNGKTSGSSLGLTFEGIYNKTAKHIDITGNVVPLSEVNNIVKSIPLLGPLISGGKNGALVAASYSMKGPTKDPSVFINPLSILTPGILRSILFEQGAEAPPPK